jgi:NitT/TauT family transport system substrate-binding protein
MVDHGIFQRNGLEVQLLFIAGGPLATKSLLTGDVQAVVTAGPASILAALGGADPVTVVGLLNTMDHTVIARPGIARPEDLRGKTLAVNQIGSADDFGFRFALRRWGIDPERDAQVLALGGQPARYKALQVGQIDATTIQPPLTAQAREAGFAALAALADLGLDYQGTCVVTTRTLIRTREGAIRRLVKAFVEGIHFMKTQRVESMKSIATFMRLQDPRWLEETYQQYTRLISRVPYPTAAGVRTILDDLAAKTPKARSAKPEDFIEPRLVKELDDAGLIRRLYGQ